MARWRGRADEGVADSGAVECLGILLAKPIPSRPALAENGSIFSALVRLRYLLAMVPKNEKYVTLRLAVVGASRVN